MPSPAREPQPRPQPCPQPRPTLEALLDRAVAAIERSAQLARDAKARSGAARDRVRRLADLDRSMHCADAHARRAAELRKATGEADCVRWRALQRDARQQDQADARQPHIQGIRDGMLALERKIDATCAADAAQRRCGREPRRPD